MDNSTLYYSTVAGTSCTWTAVGGSGAGVPSQQVAPNMNDVYVSENCGSQTNCFQANPDLRASGSCVWTASSSTVTDATDAPWTSADIGKKIYGANTSSHASAISSGNGIGTITAVGSPSSITISGTVPSTINPGSCAWYTADQTSVFAAAQAYALALTAVNGIIASSVSPNFPYRVVIRTGPGNYKVNSAVLNITAGTQGDTGISFIGSGSGTKFYPGPDFTEAGTTSGLVFEYSYNDYTISDFVVDGIGGAVPGFVNSTCCGFVSASNGRDIHVKRIIMFGPAWKTSQASPLLESYIATTGSTIEENFITGGTGFSSRSDHSSASYSSNYFGNSNQSDEWIGGGFATNLSEAANPIEVKNHVGDECDSPPCHVFTGAWVRFSGGSLYGGPVLSCDGTSYLEFNAMSISPYGGADYDGIDVKGGCVMTFRDSFVNGGNSHKVFVQSGGSGAGNVYDLGGNYFQTCQSAFGSCAPATTGLYSGTMNFFGSQSATGIAQTTTNIALTSGWGSGTNVTAAAGDSHSMTFSITLAGSSSSGSVVTVTFPTPFLVAPLNCYVTSTTGTDASLLTSVVVGTPSATSVTLTYNGTLTAADTIIEGLVCQ